MKELARSYLTHHQRSHPGHESNEGFVSQLGHSLCRQRGIRTTLPCRMARQDQRSGRSATRRTLLPATGCLRLLRQEVRRDLLVESRKHKIWKLLRRIPAIGPIRAAILIAVMQTPHRFRTKRQLWNYSGLGLETYDSAEYRAVQGQLERSRKQATVRGLNKDYNHDLKDIFKGAAMRASTASGPLRDFYENLLAKGRKPTMARLTLARKIAAITLIVWKKEVRFDAHYLKQQAA